MRRVCAALLLTVTVLLGPPAAAQQTTGEITGQVTDSTGGVLPGVTVILRSDGIAGTQTAVTGGEGRYRFPLLPPDTYQLEYMLEGFTTLRRSDVTIAVGQVADLNVQLQLGAASEVVTVTGEVPVVNAARTSVSTNYGSEWVRNAPVRRNSYFDYVNSAPGISATPPARIAPRTNWPSAPMFHTLERKHTASPSAISSSGVALTVSSPSA